MKKLILLLVFPIVSIGTQAQRAVDDYSHSSFHSSNKLINEALQRGRRAQGFYELQNTKGKVLNYEKILSEARSEDLIIGDYSTKNINRFGDVSTIINTMAFIPRAEYPEFVFEHVKALTGTNYEFRDLKNGICWLFDDTKFIKFPAKWTGNINNGRLHGSGTAFFISDDRSFYLYAKGEFQNGIPLGTIQIYAYVYNSKLPMKVEFSSKYSANVGQFHDNLAKFSLNGGKWGFVNNEGTIAISPSYESVINDFANGRAEVSKDGKEIIIGKMGNMIELTAKQKQIDAAQKVKERQEALQQEQERKRQEIAARQKRIERERAEAEAEKYRVEKFRKCQPGDIVYYSQSYEWVEGVWLFKTSHSASWRVVCYVEQNINNGERLQIRVGDVETSGDRYKTPRINGIEYGRDEVKWIFPLKDKNWHIE